MQIIKSTTDMKKYCKEQREKTIGFVPTMGFLHEGHLSLVKASKEKCEITIVSIYVNPTQFAPNEDLDDYPRDFEQDKMLCEKEGVDVIFFPSNEEMYPMGYKTYVEVEDLTKSLCGKSRPTHFKGVCTIVNKLFNIIQPDYAFFGQKDYQQSVVIKKMVDDLNLEVKVRTCPIIRETDGLALSSRNKYLSETERKDALVLNQSLQEAQENVLHGEKDCKKIKEKIIANIGTKETATIDYVEIVDKNTLEPLKEVCIGQTVIALAVKFSKARLLDNIVF